MPVAASQSGEVAGEVGGEPRFEPAAAGLGQPGRAGDRLAPVDDAPRAGGWVVAAALGHGVDQHRALVPQAVEGGQIDPRPALNRAGHRGAVVLHPVSCDLIAVEVGRGIGLGSAREDSETERCGENGAPHRPALRVRPRMRVSVASRSIQWCLRAAATWSASAALKRSASPSWRLEATA